MGIKARELAKAAKAEAEKEEEDQLPNQMSTRGDSKQTSKFEEDENEVKMGKSAFEEKLDVLQVQRAEIFQDSLDELPKHLSDILKEENSKQKEKGESEVNTGDGGTAQVRTKVMNENGELLEVIFDPVLKCYYEPTQNVYYQVKDVQKV